MDEHFESFLDEAANATVIIAPAGYGKTLALCHWVEHRLETNALNHTNDVILFFSSSALINVFLSGRDINEWLLTLLGYSTEEDMTWLLNERANNPDKLFLIIDGFDDHMFKPDQFRMLLNQLNDALALYRDHPSFKLVLTMRLSSWINYKHEFDNGENSWFMGFPKNGHPLINVPLFNTDEINRLSIKINPTQGAVTINDAVARFNHPLYFQFYYKEHKENFCLDDIDHVCIFDLISTFILNKIYLGANSADKAMLLKELVDEMNFTNKQYTVTKAKANPIIKKYHAAYNDLLNVGFLREQNKSSGFEHNILIEFSNNDFLEYTIAKKLLHD
ncbi:MAG: NACHT domain-containing protein, partial [Sphingobacteriales bacterium]